MLVMWEMIQQERKPLLWKDSLLLVGLRVWGWCGVATVSPLTTYYSNGFCALQTSATSVQLQMHVSKKTLVVVPALRPSTIIDESSIDDAAAATAAAVVTYILENLNSWLLVGLSLMNFLTMFHTLLLLSWQRITPKLTLCTLPKLTYFGPYLAEIFFFQPLRPPSPVRHRACLSSYAKLAKINDAISRKWPKWSFWAQFWQFLAILGPNNFFFENRASSH